MWRNFRVTVLMRFSRLRIAGAARSGRPGFQHPHQLPEDLGPSADVSGLRCFRQALVRDDDFSGLAVGQEFDRHQRIAISGVRGIPGEDQAARRIDGLLDAGVADRPRGDVHHDLEGAAFARVDRDGGAHGAAGTGAHPFGQHPASKVGQLTPRCWKELFADKPLRSDRYDLAARRNHADG